MPLIPLIASDEVLLTACSPARDQDCCLPCFHALWHQYFSEHYTFAAKGLYAARINRAQ